MSGFYENTDTITDVYYNSECEVIYPFTFVQEFLDTFPKIKIDIHNKKIIKVRWENNEKL